MLVRVVLHQARLLVPGLSLDEKGVAGGPRVAVLFASIDRLVAFLAAASQEGSFEDVLPSRDVAELVSPAGTRAAVVFADAAARLHADVLKSLATLVGGHAFTGASRHFVELRDASAPYGFDAKELSQAPTEHVFYHRTYTQGFDRARTLDLERLVLSLVPGLGRTADSRARLLLAQPGLGPVVTGYLARSGVRAEVASVELPDLGPRVLFRVEELPPRMTRLFAGLPGVESFVPDGEGFAIAEAHRHPVRLAALPRAPGRLVLVRADGPAIVVQDPTFVDLDALARVRLGAEARTGRALPPPDVLSLPLVLVPRTTPRRDVAACFVPKAELPLLRRVLYAKPTGRIAVLADGAFVVSGEGEGAAPLGTAFYRAGHGLFAPIGFDVAPQLSPEALDRALRLPPGTETFLMPDGTAVACAADDLVPVERALARGPAWAALAPAGLDWELDAPLGAPEDVEVRADDPGVFPLRGLDRP